jgi:hypothetical protein
MRNSVLPGTTVVPTSACRDAGERQQGIGVAGFVRQGRRVGLARGVGRARVVQVGLRSAQCGVGGIEHGLRDKTGAQQLGVALLLAARQFEIGLCLRDARLGRVDVARQRRLLAADHAAFGGEVAIVEQHQRLTTLDLVADVHVDLLHRGRDARGQRQRHARLQGAGADDALGHRALRRLDDRHCDRPSEAPVGGTRSEHQYETGDERRDEESVSFHWHVTSGALQAR